MSNSLAEKKTIDDQVLFRRVSIFGVALSLLYGTVAGLSFQFQYGQVGLGWTPMVVGLLILGTIISLMALRTAIRLEHSQKSLHRMILAYAICFRLAMLLGEPILELDYYRYLWDGKVVAAGHSPYQYSPEEVLNTIKRDHELATLASFSEPNFTIVSRVHFPELTTIYPPISQLVFGLTAYLIPVEASVWLHILVVRAAMVLFDIGTILLVGRLMYHFGLHSGWLIAYAWNPLVIKEIANSGHLDSIAVFFSVAAVVALVGKPKAMASIAAAGFSLAMGVGAKLFPAILFPALFVYAAKAGRKSGGTLCSCLFAGHRRCAEPDGSYRRNPTRARQRSRT